MTKRAKRSTALRVPRNTGLHALYYPFSRSIDVGSLKQQLLLFDTISFVDPVTSDEWRAKLFRDLEKEQTPRFRSYREFSRELPSLMADGVIKVHDPATIDAIEMPEVTAAILSDLSDSNWVRAASRPEKFSMPFRREAGVPTWQIFYPKMPSLFVRALEKSDALRRHLIEQGDEYSSWSVTYSAGSAISINTHLAVADALDCVPLTDSPMHHGLLLRKVARNGLSGGGEVSSRRQVNARSIAARLHADLLNDFMPAEVLSRLSIDDIRSFREATATIRKEFFDEMENVITSKLIGIGDFDKAGIAIAEIRRSILKDVRGYRGEIQTAREKLWPSLLSEWNIAGATMAGVGAALAAALTGGVYYTLAASIIPSAAFVRSFIATQIEVRAIQRRMSPALAYLTQLGKI